MKGGEKMQDARKSPYDLIKEFTENYVEKLFYFSLKKTGNNAEAEDLTQDIALQIIIAFNKGTIPINLSAYIWQIARNRYSVWAKEKHKKYKAVTGTDIGDYEIEDGSKSVLDEMIDSMQLALLRRELAFIKKDYRSILVAYYIENKSIKEIADIVSLSQNAVKQKLFRARQLLKEGMDMAREFGKRSYKPEGIIFAASGSQPTGLPWNVVQRKIPKNILLQANNNPSTLEELSIELGIALPYMEEEVEILHKATLLEKHGDKYITNFFILDKECLLEVYNILRSEALERSKLLNEFMDEKMSDIRALGIAEAHIEDNAIRWWLIPDCIDRLIENTSKEQTIYTPPKRANGECWGFVGYEMVDLPEATMCGHNGSGQPDSRFWAYKYGSYSMDEQCGEPAYEEAMLLCDCIRNRRNTATLSDSEKLIWKYIDGKYIHADENGNTVPDILVFENGSYEEINRIFKEHRNYGKLLQNTKRAYNAIEALFKKYSHRVLHDSLGYYIKMEMYAMRLMAIHDLVDQKLLFPPEDTSKSTYGMHVMLK
ncbi:MAG: sigma-70 family RNA polymerase sigma factor [Ruminococcaceae bacterium]|nr:sigma-70 family RNA polymerase sigma factor [Oscillospiraceae bacterium]